MKKLVQAALFVLSVLAGTGAVRAGMKDMKFQKPETAQASGVIKSFENHRLVLLVGEGKEVQEQVFPLARFTQVKGARAKDVKDLVPGKIVSVTYDAKDAGHIARVIVVLERKEAPSKPGK